MKKVVILIVAAMMMAACGGGSGSRGGDNPGQVAYDYVTALYKNDFKTMKRLASKTVLVDYETNGMPKYPDQFKNDLEEVQKPYSIRKYDSNRQVTTVDVWHRTYAKAMIDVIVIMEEGKWFVDGVRYGYAGQQWPE